MSLHIRTPQFAEKPVKHQNEDGCQQRDAESEATIRRVPQLIRVNVASTLSLMREKVLGLRGNTATARVDLSKVQQGQSLATESSHLKGFDSLRMLRSGHAPRTKLDPKFQENNQWVSPLLGDSSSFWAKTLKKQEILMHFQPPCIDTQQFKKIKIIYFNTKTPPGAVLKIFQ